MQALRVRRQSSTPSPGVQGDVLEAALAVLSDARLRSNASTHLAHCRALAEQWAAGGLAPGRTSKLLQLVLHWLVVRPAPGRAAGGSSSVLGHEVALLHCEALRLLQRLAKDGKLQLQPADARQLLKLLHALCTNTGGAPAAFSSTQLDLLCCCADVLGLFPQLAAPAAKREAVAGAVGVLVLALGAHTKEQAAAEGGAAYVRLLKALQTLLVEAKKDHNCNVGALVPALQRLLAYGLHQQPGTPWHCSVLARPAPAPQSSQHGAGRNMPHTVSRQPNPPTIAQGLAASAGTPLQTPASSVSRGAYVPPHLRRASADAPEQGLTAAPPHPAGNSPASAPSSPQKQLPPVGGGIGATQQGSHRRSERSTLDSSDSELSDSEGGPGGEVRASRVRLGALAVLQVMAKSDSKALHPAWTELLPTSEAVLAAHCAPPSGATLAHVLLHDPAPRVRQAAAVTISTLLEGPAQRAYLGIAECGGMGRQPVRGFLTLSMSLGLVAVALHAALLDCLRAESNPGVLLGALRALGTLLLAAPYHRLPPQLLLSCVERLQRILQQATTWGSPGSASRPGIPLPPDSAPLAVACLSCLAAAFGTKQPSPALAQYLHPASRDSGSSGAALVGLLFECASCGSPGVELEAVLALRGLAQQYWGAVQGEWGRVLGLAQAGVAAMAKAVPQSPRAQQDGTLPEKLAHQSIRLAGDFLAANDPHGGGAQAEDKPRGFSLPPSRQSPAASPQATSAAMGESNNAPAQPALGQQHVQRWQAIVHGVLGVAIVHGSPLLRSAVLAVIAGISPEGFGALPPQLQWQLLEWCRTAAAKDESSPVRVAAAKAMGALATTPCCLEVPSGLVMLLAALQAGCKDQVLAVRVPAAASLAALCHMLSSWLGQCGLSDGVLPLAYHAPPALQAGQCGSPTQQIGSTSPSSSGPAPAGGAVPLALPTLLALATQAAQGSEKMQASGVEALGHAFACLGHFLGGSARGGAPMELGAALVDAAGDALLASLQSSTPKVQWSACGSAGLLLQSCSRELGPGQGLVGAGAANRSGLGSAESSAGTASSSGGGRALPDPHTAAEGRQGWASCLLWQGHRGLSQLLSLLGSCAGMRTRARAAAALRSMQGVAWYRGSCGELLEPVCRALFAGKACGFFLPDLAGSSNDPADSSLGPQLEEELVLSLLHLLSLLGSPVLVAEAGQSSAPSAAAAPRSSGWPGGEVETAPGASGVPVGQGAGMLQPYWQPLCRLVQAAVQQASPPGQANEAAPACGVESDALPRHGQSDFLLSNEALGLSSTAALGVLHLAQAHPVLYDGAAGLRDLTPDVGRLTLGANG